MQLRMELRLRPQESKPRCCAHFHYITLLLQGLFSTQHDEHPPEQRVPDVCKMTCTGLQDAELGWCGQPSREGRVIHSAEHPEQKPWPPLLWAMQRGGCSGSRWADSLGSSLGSSQEQPCWSPHHSDSCRKGPIQSTDLTVVSELCPWAAADGCRVRNRDNEKNIKVGIWRCHSSRG